MLTTLKNAFKIKEIRTKILFTLAMLVVIRLGSQLPVPGVDRDFFSTWFAQQTGDAFSFFDAITGGSFANMSILALNINPYITSSIIMQLLTIAIPKLEEMQRDGDDGRKKIASITRYVTVVLALIQATAMSIGFGRQGLLTNYNAGSIITCIAALTAGSAFLMWVGERITEKGIGNGISIVLVINIVSRLPQDLASLFNQFVIGKAPATAILAACIIIAIIILMVVLVIVLNAGVRKIPVQYAKKVQGRKMVGGQTSNIPLKVNTSGVIPVIFASSIMQTPIIICSLVGYQG
ncbi:MAG: preprotein translocase subunit SecY, partial [Acetatifactor sp.]|nr:preprotein translocase subunit SecY [Acetatifactor sp.]